MAEFESDNFFDGDWDDKGDLAWNEFDWAQYLGRCDNEIARFQKIYQRLIETPDRVDEAARQMGWDRDDWSANPEDNDLPETEGFSRPAFDLGLPAEEFSEPAPEDADPYSAQKHPVFVVTRALMRDVDAFHQAVVRRSEINLPNDLVWDSARSIKDTELHISMAVNTLDLGDFALAICYFKHAFRSLNQLFATTSRYVEFLPDRLSSPFTQAVNMRLFDLRDVWLRVIGECREEGRRYGENDDSQE